MSRFSTPRTPGLTSAAYRASGKKPLFDAETCARIKRRNDEGVSFRELSLAYDVSIATIRAAIRRAEFGDGK